MKKLFSILGVVLVGLVIVVPQAFAHVVVRPGEVGVGERVNFVVSVPTEEDTPTTQIRLLVPEQLKSVRPNVKPGWNIELVKSGDGEDARITEIIWSGGSIPDEQRDEFIFSSQAPAKEAKLVWKAYQTYEDGTVVAWDKSPQEVKTYEEKHPVAEGDHDDNAPRPYSETKVINDLQKETAPAEDNKGDHAFLLSILAVLMSAAALGLQFYKKK